MRKGDGLRAAGYRPCSIEDAEWAMEGINAVHRHDDAFLGSIDGQTGSSI